MTTQTRAAVTRKQLHAFRARRQFLAPEARGHTSEDVFEILKGLQPYPPIAGSMPGSAPHPRSRVVGYQEEWSQRWRAVDMLVKGRFMNGNVAYVTREDLALYAAAFRRRLRDPLPLPARSILGLLKRYGPMYKSALQELSDIERGRFNRALASLYQAFEVMELQRQVDWDSPWDLYRRAFPDADPDSWGQAAAQAEVLCRFTRAFGPATVVEMSDWSGWRQRTVQKRVDDLLRQDAVVALQVEGQDKVAYLSSAEVPALESVAPISPFLEVLPSNDPLVLPQGSRVKEGYRSERLPYCLGVVVEDGAIVGAAWGHYKRKYAHIEELNLEPDIVHNPPHMDDVLAAVEAFVSGGYVPIHIYGINGPAAAPWTDEILRRNGYAWLDGYYVKE
jgi:hypothetical protein